MVGAGLSESLRKLGDVTVLAHNLDDGSAEDAFLADAQRYRRELLAHCYRMTGSLHDAEDLVQETYLRAWKSYKGFQGKSSVRTWLYRIATNTCLTALDGRQRRPLPTGLGAPSSDPDRRDRRTQRGAVAGAAARIRTTTPPIRQSSSAPASRCGWRSSRPCSTCPPRQRAVLVLRDVLQWKAAEVGDAIGASTAAVNSLLQRARAQLDAVGPSEDDELHPAGFTRGAGSAGPLHRGVRGLRHRQAGGAVHRRGDLGDAAVRRLVPGAGGHRHAVARRSAPPRRPAICG